MPVLGYVVKLLAFPVRRVTAASTRDHAACRDSVTTSLHPDQLHAGFELVMIAVSSSYRSNDLVYVELLCF